MYTLHQISTSDDLVRDLEGVDSAHLTVELFRRFNELYQETVGDRTFFYDNRGAVIYLIGEETIYAPQFMFYEEESFYVPDQKRKILYRVFRGSEDRQKFLSLSQKLDPSKFNFAGPYLHYSDLNYAFTFKVGEDQFYDFDYEKRLVMSEFHTYSLLTLEEVPRK